MLQKDKAACHMFPFPICLGTQPPEELVQGAEQVERFS